MPRKHPEPTEIQYVKPASLRPDPDQPRKAFFTEQTKQLAESVRQEGIINPIEVDSEGVIVTGEYRWRAAKMLGLQTVPVKLWEQPKGEKGKSRRFIRQLHENLHQMGSDNDGMTDWDIGVAVCRLLDEARAGRLDDVTASDAVRSGRGKQGPQPNDKHYSHVARVLGKDEAFVRQHESHIRSPKVPERLREAYHENKVNPTLVRDVTRVKDPALREMVAEQVVDEIEQAEAVEQKSPKKKGKQHRPDRVRQDSVRRVITAAQEQPEKAREIVSTLKAGDSRPATEAKLKKVAPTLTDAVDEQMTSSDRIDKLARELVALLEETGSISSLPKAGRAKVLPSLDRLKDILPDYLADSPVVEGVSNVTSMEVVKRARG